MHSNLCLHCGLPVKVSQKSSSRFCCYGCAFVYQLIGGVDGESRPVSWILVKLGISAFFAMNVMGFALALHSSSVYPDFFESISRTGKLMDEMMRYLLLFLSAPVLFLLGVPLFENMIRQLKEKRWSVDGLIGLGVGASVIYSLISTFTGRGPLYYDVAVMVLVFLSLGRFLEAHFRYKTAKSLEKLLAEDQREAPVNVGDEIEIRQGSRIPADGVVSRGEGLVDTASLSGESLPLVRKEGDPVLGGMTLVEGFMRIRVTCPESESWLARIRQVIEKAKQSKAPIEKLADQIAVGFTIFSVASALLAFVLGTLAHGVNGGLLRGLAVLVIACPCALGVATPLAFWKVYERLTRRGILFKDLGRLETLAKVRGAFFDKTGTLTETNLVLDSIEKYTSQPEVEVLRMAASAAQASDHPLSRALVREARSRNVPLEAFSEVATKVGEGLSVLLPGSGKIFLGSARYLESQGISSESPLERGVAEGDGVCKGNNTPRPLRGHPSREGIDGGPFLLAGWDNQLKARFSFREHLRPRALTALQWLVRENLEVGILTGAGAGLPDGVLGTLPVKVVTGLSPEDKMNWIAEWEREKGPALMVGDGLNDAPVIGRASTSLALGSGLDQTRAQADFVLPDDDLGKIPWLIEVSRRTLAKIKLNLFWAFVYNAAAIPLAVIGMVSPILAGAAMVASSLFVISNSIAMGERT